jgi:hypothetical protein
MYPPGALDSSNIEATKLLPLEHVYVISIEDFERLVVGASSPEFDLPSFLVECVKADREPETAVYFFEQHLHTQKVPRRYSELVTRAVDGVTSRIEQAYRVGKPD